MDQDCARTKTIQTKRCMAALISVTRGVSWRRDLRTHNFDPFSPHYPLHRNATREAHRGVGRTHPTQTLSSSRSKSIPRSGPNREPYRTDRKMTARNRGTTRLRATMATPVASRAHAHSHAPHCGSRRRRGDPPAAKCSSWGGGSGPPSGSITRARGGVRTPQLLNARAGGVGPCPLLHPPPGCNVRPPPPGPNP